VGATVLADERTRSPFSTWHLQQCQIIQSSALIHHLYSVDDHAFKYLWEVRLGQSPEDSRALGRRPVAGGGLRLLLPPHKQADDEEPRSIEIRAESFLAEPRKLLIETISWPKPRSVQAPESFAPGPYLRQVEDFTADEVWSFFTSSQRDEGPPPEPPTP
jgi:hypothetical protein